jgi:hypothetical protein
MAHPEDAMGVEQNHFIASHSTSMGDMMSPMILTLPFQMPSRLLKNLEIVGFLF